jgi:hypothetical protein
LRSALVVLGLLAAVVPASAEEKVLAPPSPDQIKINKLNAEVGKEVVGRPGRLSEVEVKKEKPLPPGVLEGFRRETAVPSDAVVVQISQPAAGRPVQTASLEERTKAKERQKEEETRILKGYCFLDRKLEIRGLYLPYELACTFENGEAGTLYGTFLPDFKSYSLVFKPLEVEIDGVRYAVVKGEVMLGDRSSLNLADKVNKKVLEKVALQAFSSGTQEGLAAYQEYVEGKYTKTETVGTENPITVQEKNYPDNYPIVRTVLGVLKGISQGLKEAFESQLKSVPVIFEVYPKTLYVRLEVKRK